MLQQLKHYEDTIIKHQQSLDLLKSNFKNQLLQMFQQYVSKQLQLHYQGVFKQRSQSLSEQLATIQYYIQKVYQLGSDQQKDERELKVGEQLKKVNMFSVFKSVEDKIQFNTMLLHDIEIMWVYPQNQEELIKQNGKYYRLKNQILQDQLKDLLGLINSENQELPLRKINKQMKQISDQYSKLTDQVMPLNKIPTFNLTTIKLKDTVGAICAVLFSHKYLECIDVCVISQSGKISEGQYANIMEAICKPNRISLKKLQMKIMDMQFCQQKCEVIKRKLKPIKALTKFTIVNYYKQCKLGNFSNDFNWKPYRAGVNVGCQVWK